MEQQKVFPTACFGFDKKVVLDYIYEQDTAARVVVGSFSGGSWSWISTPWASSSSSTARSISRSWRFICLVCST